MGKNQPEQYRTGTPYEFHFKAVPATPEQVQAHRQRKIDAARQERREALMAKLRHYLVLSGCLVAGLVVGILIGRFLLP